MLKKGRGHGCSWCEGVVWVCGGSRARAVGVTTGRSYGMANSDKLVERSTITLFMQNALRRVHEVMKSGGIEYLISNSKHGQSFNGRQWGVRCSKLEEIKRDVFCTFVPTPGIYSYSSYPWYKASVSFGQSSPSNQH